MSELVSSVELKKADGNPIKFNFQFENGLPIKPLLIVNGSIWYSSKDNCYGVSIILTKDDLKNKRYLSVHLYPDDSVEIVTSENGPRPTSKGLKWIDTLWEK